MNLAAALFRIGDGDDQDEAMRLLTVAVTDVTPGESTRLHYTLLGNLAQLHLVRGDFAAMRETLEQACNHADRVIDAARTTATRLAHVAAAGDLFQRLAFINAHMQDARGGVHAVERSRARWRRAERYDGVVVDNAVAQRLEQGESILYIGTCELGTWAVILIAGGGAAAWTAQGRSTADLAPVLRDLQSADGTAAVSAALTRASSILAPVLAIVSRIAADSGIHRLAVIAGGPLAGLPLGALDHGEGSLDSSITIRYLTAANTDPPTIPSESAMEAAEGAETDSAPFGQLVCSAPPAREVLLSLAVVDPTGDLTFAATEIDAVRRYAPDTLEPAAGSGVRGWLLDMLPTARHLHMACHAVYEPSDPLASRFVLGEHLSLTVADLDAIDLSALDLVVASCCQSGVVDQRAADELVGLAHALIAAGANRVIAALWDIDDAGTSLLVAKLYDELAGGAGPADALRAAQVEVRSLTMAQLAHLSRDDSEQSWVPAGIRAQLRALGLHPAFRKPDARPFEDPAHWSSLVYIQA